MNNFNLSAAARDDILDIFKYGRAKFGKNQSVKFIREIEKLIPEIATWPEIGRRRSELRKALFSFPYKGYVIFYQKWAPGILIVRILHGSRDLPDIFKSE